MRILLLSVLTVCTISSTYAQSTDSVKVVNDTYNNYEELRKKQSQAEIEYLTYVDSTFNFQVDVPAWLQLMETGSVNIWGGTLPAVDGIQNAIAIKCFDKKEYKSLKVFKEYVAENLVFGQLPPWSNTHQCMGKKELGKYEDLGDSYIVYLMHQGLIYHCKYILLESKTAYIWIDFTSTKETFEKNLYKFDEFLNGFKVTNFK